ncbi:MAG: hypothetical protein ILO10_04525 [Kiritimatiellae bacterium]|nr:hypothetical protein [Kiritimatiellia bacterium]
MARIYGKQEILRNYASGFSQDVMKNSLAEFIAPRVVTGLASGQYKTFSDKNAFLAPDAQRAIGGKANRIGFESDDAWFNCTPYALEAVIDEFERERAGDNQALLEEAKTKALTTQAALAHEKAVFAKINATVSAVSSRGTWDSNTDPIEELDEQIVSIAGDTGMMPNRMVIGLGAFQILRNNAKVIARQPGSANIGVTTSQLAAMLINPQIDIRVGVLAYDQNKSGKAASKQSIVGSRVYIFVGSDNPTQYDPSFAKTFSVSPGSIFDVRMYQEDPRTDVIAVDWTAEPKVTAAIACRRLDISAS